MFLANERVAESRCGGICQSERGLRASGVGAASQSRTLHDHGIPRLTTQRTHAARSTKATTSVSRALLFIQGSVRADPRSHCPGLWGARLSE